MALTRAIDVPLTLVVLLTALAGYGYTMDRCCGSGDSAEMQLAACTLGIAHPPGYALQILAGRLFAAIPIGALPARVTWLSVVSAAAALALVAATLRLCGVRRSAATAALLALGASDLYWRNARIGEVYAFHAAWVATALFAAALERLPRKSSHRMIVPPGPMKWLALGAACALRPTTLLTVPFFLMSRDSATIRSTRSVAIAVGCFLVPALSCFVYYASRDRPGAEFNYLNDYDRTQPYQAEQAPLPATNESFSGRAQRAAWLMTAAQFRGHGLASGEQLRDGLVYYARRLALFDLSALCVPLILLGIWRWRRRVDLFAPLLAIWGAETAGYLASPAWDRYTFLTPGLIALAMLAAAGGESLLGGLPRAARLIRVALCMPGVLLLLSNLPANNGANPQRLFEENAAAFPDPVATTEPILRRRAVEEILAKGIPPDARLFAPFVDGRAIQAQLRLEAGRTDVDVVVCDDPFAWQAMWKARNNDRQAFAVDDGALVPMETFAPRLP